MRVLLIAESANPEWVSVPLEGWSHSQAIGRRVSAHLVTQVRNAAAIGRAGLGPDDFTAINSEKVARIVDRLGTMLRGGSGKGWTTLMALAPLSYAYFERLVWRQFGPAIRAGEFDVVHRLTPLSPTLPSSLARRCRRAGVPFILGPLNGGVPWPRAFDAARRKEREWLSYFRWAHKLLPGYRGTRKHASAIIIGSQDTWQQMPARYRDKCIYIPENAIDPQRFEQRRTRRAVRPLRALFVGRLVPYKGADMLIEAAAALIRRGDVHLKIIGDGPQRGELEALITREQLGHGVDMVGWVEHAKLQAHLCEADLFTFPSIREFGGAVALEAMAVGLVPLVIRYGGLGELVTERTGFLIDMSNRPGIIAALRSTLERVVAEPSLIEARAEPARRRALTQFTWDAKAAQVVQVYEWVLGQRPDKPDWGMPLGD